MAMKIVSSCRQTLRHSSDARRRIRANQERHTSLGKRGSCRKARNTSCFSEILTVPASEPPPLIVSLELFDLGLVRTRNPHRNLPESSARTSD